MLGCGREFADPAPAPVGHRAVLVLRSAGCPRRCRGGICGPGALVVDPARGGSSSLRVRHADAGPADVGCRRSWRPDRAASADAGRSRSILEGRPFTNRRGREPSAPMSVPLRGADVPPARCATGALYDAHAAPVWRYVVHPDGRSRRCRRRRAGDPAAGVADAADPRAGSGDHALVDVHRRPPPRDRRCAQRPPPPCEIAVAETPDGATARSDDALFEAILVEEALASLTTSTAR